MCVAQLHGHDNSKLDVTYISNTEEEAKKYLSLDKLQFLAFAIP